MSDQLVVSLLLEQCDRIEERFDGYREEIKETVADILLREKEHSLSATNIKQKIVDQISRVSAQLAASREESNDLGEVSNEAH